MNRPFYVLMHRYVGLVMALFLLIAGVTGSFLAFYEELDTLVNVDLAKVAVQSAPPQDLIALRKTVLNHFPQADISYVSLESKQSLSATFFIEHKKDAQGKPITKLDNDQITL